MLDLIDRQELISWLSKDPLFPQVESFGLTDVIKSRPSVDAEPVRHGRWEWVDAPVFGNPYGSYKCDCGNYVPHKTNYCPNCGAKMDLPEPMVYPQVEGITPTVVKMDEVTE